MRTLLKIIVVLFVIWGGWQVWKRVHPDQLALRTAYWTKKVTHEVKVGEPRAAVQAWIQANFASERDAGGRAIDHFDPYTQSFFLVAEDVPASGLKFPCSHFLVNVRIRMGKDGRVLERDVGTNGICV